MEQSNQTFLCSIYISGPITHGDQKQNVYEAINIAYEFMDAGIAPFTPHLTWFMDKYKPRTYEDWLSQDFYWITKCTAFFRLPGYSPGADREEEFAFEQQKPIFKDVKKAIKWLRLSHDHQQ